MLPSCLAEKLQERRVRYALEVEGRFCVVEDVPAHVNDETGEQFFSAATVEQLQRIIEEESNQAGIISASVYRYTG